MKKVWFVIFWLLVLSFAAAAQAPITITCAPLGCRITNATITQSGTPNQTVTVLPNTANLQVSGTQQFTATVMFDPFNRGVSWTLAGPGCSGATCGTISASTSASGVAITYTAPASPPSPNSVTLTATSVTNPQVNSSIMATIAVTTPPATTVVNPCSPNVQTAAALNTFSCSPSQGTAIGVLVTSSSATTTSGVQACTAANVCTTLTQGCPPSGSCAANGGGGMATGFYGFGLAAGQAVYKVTNSLFGNQIQIFPYDISNNTSFDTASMATSGTPSTGPSQTIGTQAAGVVLSANATLNVTGAAAPFTFVTSPSNTVGGSAYTITSAAGTYTPTWTQTNATYALYSMAFASGFVTPVVGVTVNPATASKVVSGTLPVTATISNGTQGVTWALSGAGCSGATCGTISSASSASGVAITYTAPGSVPSPATVTMTATSVDDGTKTASTTITVTAAPVVGVTVSPTSKTLTANATQTFTCTVTNDAGLAGCDWTLGGTSPQGSLSTAHTASGVALTYTAGSSASSAVTLTAASTTDATKTAVAAITVTTPAISVSIAPNFVTLNAGGSTQGFTATVVNSGSSVNWTLSCSQADCGSLSAASGATTTYTSPAPNVSVLVTLTATSIADGTKTATAQININSTNNTQFKCTSPCPSFPEAQGSGATALGGRGGRVIEVNTLADSGSGSLRDCAVNQSGARTCVFRVSGMITQLSDFSVGNPFLTIAGQSAPGEVILGGNNSRGFTLRISTHDVVVRYLTISPDNSTQPTGPDTGTVGLSLVNAVVNPQISDHITLRWAGNKSYNITSNFGACLGDHVLQWSLSYENHEAHPVGISSSSNDNATTSACMKNADYHHNVIVNQDHRIPEYNEFNMRWVNNYVYNWSGYALQGLGATITDVINNVWDFNNLVPGSSQSGPHPIHSSNTSGSNQWPGSIPGTASFYVAGNIGNIPGNTGHTTPNTDQYGDLAQSVDGEPGNEQGAFPSGAKRGTPQAASNAFPIIPDNFSSIAVAQNILLPTIGNSQHLDCNGEWVTHRNVQDVRIVNEVKNHGTGGFWPNGVTFTGFIYCPPATSNCSSPTTPLPARTSDYTDQPQNATTSCHYTTHDVPDEWKTRYHLSTTDTGLCARKDDATGLTFCEDYWDHLVP